MATAGFQLLPPTIITAAATVTGPVIDLKNNQQKLPLSLAALAKFTYGSGGTTVDVWVQSSLDGGTTWHDVIHFPQFTTASGKSVGAVNRQGNKVPAAVADGAGAGATGVANDGLLGPVIRVKAASTGTYAGNTTLEVDGVGEN